MALRLLLVMAVLLFCMETQVNKSLQVPLPSLYYSTLFLWRSCLHQNIYMFFHTCRSHLIRIYKTMKPRFRLITTTFLFYFYFGFVLCAGYLITSFLPITLGGERGKQKAFTLPEYAFSQSLAFVYDACM